MGQTTAVFQRAPGRALRVGLTGGIGVGKSTVAALWEEAGARVVGADQLAREVVRPGSPGLLQLAEEFGPQILAGDGSLDRARLAELAFADPAHRQRLEQITHPLIAQAAADFFAALTPAEVGVYDVPLLVENKMAGQFDVVVVVEAPLDLRLARLVDRGLSREDAQLRIAAQATDEQRRAVADVVIDNSGSPEDLAVAARGVGLRLGIA